ncbi:MAG: phosphatidylserine decarboxylase [Methylococcales symbiont of Iophon sp. n. MRB-2018]|nr:MAG: phosphatidylserine decarboxylase [Methylococcales symbiont of Iophon sp. n. MRB-2018]KAF3979650.1 MAG: phosphatidylserine decarboxylase [Methylococcales symbiont of Iophon sp. n. MRB-2018]
MTFKEALTTLPQYILPHHFLSMLMSKLTHSEIKVLKNLGITQIIKIYGVNMSEAKEQDINNFASFNHFFTRKLKEDARPVTADINSIACPADGTVSQAGLIEQGDIFQAKGKSFTTIDLLGGDKKTAAAFENGCFTTIYLSPKDYHRLHMPIKGTLTKMIHIPGSLFSVNTATTNSVPRLFARNERVVCVFDTEIGAMALILVGAIFVSSIETTWHGVVTPPTIESVRSWQYQNDAPVIEKGEEMGRFNMGSTIIVLFAKDKVEWDATFEAGKTVKLGEMIGKSFS